jgi:hypothetical protein
MTGSTTKPICRGLVRTRSADPFAPPVIQTNYLVEELDRRTVPRMISANFNASIRMIADKASDLIRGRTPPESALGAVGV